MPANRVAEVNRELKRLGHAERLCAGRGYYYFIEGDAHTWPASSVNVFRSADLSVAQWIEEYNNLKAASL